jgi:hypothetical protein
MSSQAGVPISVLTASSPAAPATMSALITTK